MPAVTSKSDLDALFQKHSNDPTEPEVDFTDPPGGINNGVARLVSARLGTYRQGAKQQGADVSGKPFIQLRASIVHPKSVTEIIKTWKDGKVEIVGPVQSECEGMFTSTMLPLCDTGKGEDATSKDENIKYAFNKLRHVGGPEFTSTIKSMDGLKAALAALEKVKPYVRFSSNRGDPTAQYPNPRAFQRWYEQAQAPKSNNNVLVVSHESPAPAAPASEEAPPNVDDLDALVVAANAEDASADEHPNIDALLEKAKEAGVEDSEVESAENWEAVATMIKEKQGGGEESSGEATEEGGEESGSEEGERIVLKGENWYYKPLDAKTKKRAKKAVEVEVLDSNKKNKTCTIKDLSSNRQWKNVGWDDLQAEEE